MAVSPVSFDRRIDNILSNTDCRKHNVSVGIPCYEIDSGVIAGKSYLGVCGKRIKKAGYIGPTSPTPQPVRRSR